MVHLAHALVLGAVPDAALARRGLLGVPTVALAATVQGTVVQDAGCVRHGSSVGFGRSGTVRAVVFSRVSKFWQMSAVMCKVSRMICTPGEVNTMG